jgi:signal transduction histidine kinase
MNMGGELKVSSEPGVGSMFIIQIKKAGYKSLPISS